MTTTAAWIPVEDAFDGEVVARLTESGQRFTRCLRYNLPAHAPIACATTSGAEGPTAYFIVRPTSGEDHEARLERLIEDAGVSAWVWRPAEGPPPPLEAVRKAQPQDVESASAIPTFDPFEDRSLIPR